MSTTLSRGDLLNPYEASQVLGVKEQTLAVWRTTGRHNLPFIRVGRSIKYRRSDLDAWLESRTMTHTGQAAE